jgi:molybdopterin/thiamine biosynthesis adenylyltransferase
MAPLSEAAPFFIRCLHGIDIAGCGSAGARRMWSFGADGRGRTPKSRAAADPSADPATARAVLCAAASQCYGACLSTTARCHGAENGYRLMSDPSVTPEPFDYATAFSRTIGWITGDEQAKLRSKRVAIAGLGGVGGSHLLTLTRLGIQSFNVADMDRFGTENFNRQAGAFQSTVGQTKVEVVSRMARDINPDLDINKFPNGVTLDNMEEFLSGVDLYVDGLDFFVLDIRAKLFALCAERGIPAITAAPLGMGAAVLAFLPGQTTFEEYFRLEGHPKNEQLLRFMVGLAPAVLHQGYLVDPSAVDLVRQRGPSTPMACEICAGIAGTQALKILLGRGKVVAAPHGLHFDAYRNKLVHTWRPGGNSNPLQRLILSLARRRFMRK